MGKLNFAKKDKCELKTTKNKWKILMVDDDVEVHSITKSVLKNIEFDNRRLEFVSAYSGKEALDILTKEDDFALILLDVVMETDDAGLVVAKDIREKLKNYRIRIILRTGEPGFAPEKEVILNYDINDYKEKTELTASKLFSTIISSLRSFRDIEDIEKNKLGLRKIIEASKSIYEMQSLNVFAEGVVAQMTSIFNLKKSILLSSCEDKYCILYENGDFSKEMQDKKILECLDKVVKTKTKCRIDENIYVAYISSGVGFPEIIYLEGKGKLTDLDIRLVEVFISNIAVAHDNICLHEQMIEEKETHIKDLDKKVKEKTLEIKRKLEELTSTQAQLIQSEKLAGLGSMVAGVSHEINTPVGMALTGVSYLIDESKELQAKYRKNDMSEDDFTEFLEHLDELHQSILINLEKAASLVKSFKQVAVDQNSGENRVFKLKEYIEEVLISLHNRIKKTNHIIQINIDDNLLIDSNPGAFSQIITNLVLNSLIHAFNDNDGGIIVISAEVKNKKLFLQYEDNGRGMEKEVTEHIFEPFFTTNRSKGGSGLGMNVVYNIVKEKLKGEISITSAISKGTKVDIVVDL